MSGKLKYLSTGSIVLIKPRYRQHPQLQRTAGGGDDVVGDDRLVTDEDHRSIFSDGITIGPQAELSPLLGSTVLAGDAAGFALRSALLGTKVGSVVERFQIAAMRPGRRSFSVLITSVALQLPVAVSRPPLAGSTFSLRSFSII